MREMHKWKDRVELRLDNRQIFFLFFGVSVVGCFIFALGVMVGRRADLGPGGPLAQVQDDPLAELEALDDLAPEVPVTFKDGLAASTLTQAPKTRTPEEVAGASAARQTKEETRAQVPATASRPDGTRPTPPRRAGQTATSGGKPPDAAGKREDAASPAASKRRFTLQMKAFARAEEARKFADRLRRNGHDVRVETKEVRGRVWHRVRLGSFASWDEALAAKAEFERAEHIIAYVVRE